jgi:hypothetical protein
VTVDTRRGPAAYRDALLAAMSAQRLARSKLTRLIDAPPALEHLRRWVAGRRLADAPCLGGRQVREQGERHQLRSVCGPQRALAWMGSSHDSDHKERAQSLAIARAGATPARILPQRGGPSG